MGRQKLEMKKISHEGNLVVTFSKRRAGVFKKASELCALCGGEIAIIVFSPDNKRVYSFGHRNVKHVIDKYSAGENPNPTTESGVLQGPAEPHLAELTDKATGLDDQLDTQRAHGEWLADERKQREAVDWFRAPVGDLQREQLQTLNTGFKELLSSVTDRIKNLTVVPPAENLASSDKEGGEALNGSGHSVGIEITPQGYALCFSQGGLGV